MKTRQRDKEAGSVLILTLLVTLVILGIGLTAMWLSSSGMKMSSNMTRRQEALYAAEAGMEHARSILANTVTWNNLLTGCGSSLDDTGPGGRGVVICEGTPAAPLANYLMGTGATITPIKVRGLGKITYTIFVRNDDAEAVTTGFYTDADARIVVRAEGTGRDGLSFFAIEAIMSKAASLPDEDNYSQLGGSAQNQNSSKGKMPLSPPP